MSDAVYRSGDWSAARRRSIPIGQATLCAASLLAYASASLWMLYGRPVQEPDTRRVVVATAPGSTHAATPVPTPAKVLPLRFAQAFAPASDTGHPALAPAARIVGLLDPDFAGRYAPSPFHAASTAAPFPPAAVTQPVRQVATADVRSETDPLPSQARIAAAPLEDEAEVPLPLPRPTFVLPEPKPSAARRLAALPPPQATADAPGTPPSQPGFFERMFGARPGAPALAYAPDDGGLPGLLGRPASPDRYTAVYNIAAHTVTLPDGRRLEAHSGLGSRLDDPRSVNEHMRGATPTTLYDLTLRESLFHGVRALRLTPVDPNATHGRLGLLAHTFMLGPRGDSNGCVVFRNYTAFLQAYESGAIRRLAVVAGG